MASAAELAARAREIGQALRTLDADLVALQEIETEAAFEAVRAEVAGTMPHGVFGETGWPGSLDVAAVSRHEILAVRRHRPGTTLVRPDGTRTGFTRELLEIHLDVAERRAVVFVAHFRSKNDDDAGRRWAEAEATGRKMVEATAAWPEALVVLAGDLNDVPGSPPLDALEQDGRHRRVAAELGAAAATLEWQGEAIAIDHIYRDTRSQGAYLDGTARVFGDPGGWAGSDHAALRATFSH